MADLFLDGVASTSEKAVTLAKETLSLFSTDEERVRGLRLRRGSALQVLQALQKSPVVSPTRLAEQTALASIPF